MAKNKCVVCKFNNALTEYEKHPSIGAYLALKQLALVIFDPTTGAMKHESVVEHTKDCPTHQMIRNTEIRTAKQGLDAVTDYFAVNTSRIIAALAKEQVFYQRKVVK